MFRVPWFVYCILRLFPSPSTVEINAQCFYYANALLTQRLGFWFFQRTVGPNPKRLAMDLESIGQCINSLRAVNESKPYQVQKSGLWLELEAFFFFLFLHLKHFVLQHLRQDRKGKRKIHRFSCTLFCIKHPWVCSRPATLAAGTGDSIFGKLCSLFSKMGKGGDWNDSSGTGNPASHYIVWQYLLHLREEQAEARVSPKQAVLFF